MTVNITGTAISPSGNVKPGAIITFRTARLDVVSQGGNFVIPDDVIITTAIDGTVDFNILPGQYVAFTTAVGNRSVKFSFNVADVVSADFADCVGAAWVPIPPDSVTVAQDARDEAVAAASDAATSATSASESAANVASAIVDERTFTTAISGKTINLENNTLVATSSQISDALTDKTGSGLVVFSESPMLSGIPTSTTASNGTNTSQIATTEFVNESRGANTPQMFGAAADGYTDDSTALNDGLLNGPLNTLKSNLYYGNGSALLNGRMYGDGIVEDTDGKRARFFSSIKDQPSRGSHSSILTAFNGDFSRVPFPVEHRITGYSTLGNPTSGYLYTPEAYPHFTYLFNSSGHNQSTTGNDGRTSAVAYRTVITNSGQGDAMCYNFSVFVNGEKSGANGPEGWLANPAGSALAGEIIAGHDGVYLNPMEINMQGNTYDVAGVGLVLNMDRNNDTGALGAGWDGVRTQSKGSSKVNSAFRTIGPHAVGVNTVQMTDGDAAVAIKATQKIYFDAGKPPTGNLFDIDLGDTYISAPVAGGGLNLVVNNKAVLQLSNSSESRTQHLANFDIRPGIDTGQSVHIYGSSATAHLALGQVGNASYLQAKSSGSDDTVFSIRTSMDGIPYDTAVFTSSGSMNLSRSGSSLEINGIKVVSGRKLGWSQPTGTANRSTFSTNTVTTSQLAEIVKALIDDLINHGLIGE